MPVATPSTPLASVYATSTGILTVACTLAQPCLSASLSTLTSVSVAPALVERALMKVSGYVGFAGVNSETRIV